MSSFERFKKLPVHEDNVGEIISAEQINIIQTGIENQHRTIYDLRDVNFLNKSLFVLENNNLVNSLWVDTIEDNTKINLQDSLNIIFNPDEKMITLSPAAVSGVYYSETHTNCIGANIKNAMLAVIESKPAGTNIQYEISNNTIDYVSIVPGVNILTNFSTNGSQITVRATFSRTSITESPCMYSIAVYYYNNNLIKLDLYSDAEADEEEELPGLTILERDPVGKVVKVDAPEDDTFITYDPITGILIYTVTIKEGFATYEKMLYDINGQLVGTLRLKQEATDVSVINAPDIIASMIVPEGVF